MKATKYTMSVQMQGLSKDIFRGMLTEVADQLDKEAQSFEIKFDDGDSISFNIRSEEVEF